MRYLSIDLESTGLEEKCHIIEFAMVPFDAATKTIEKSLCEHTYVQCPSFEILKPHLHPWVIDHNRTLIEKAASEGRSLSQFKEFLVRYLESPTVKNYFKQDKIILFGKSMNAIDLPFLNRELGWDFMRKYFNHKNLDLSSVAYHLIDLGFLPPGYDSSTELMKFMQMGTVAHTALEDAVHTAEIYLKLLDMIHKKWGTNLSLVAPRVS